MQIQFYKPNPRNTGTAFSCNVAKGALWFNLIKQASWNDETKKGSFRANVKNPEKKLSIKFNAIEAAGMVDAINRNVEYSFIHPTKDSITNGKISPYLKDEKQIGYSFVSFRNKSPFLIGFTFGEAEMFKLFLKKFVESSFDSDAKDTLQDPDGDPSSVDSPTEEVAPKEDSSGELEF